MAPQSYAKKMLRGMKLVAGDETGTWTLGVCFRNSFHIEENMRQVIENQGFQWKDASKDHYIKFGVNWGYTNTQSDNHMDSTSMVAVGALLLSCLRDILSYTMSFRFQLQMISAFMAC